MCARVFLVFAVLSWSSAGVKGEASVKIQTYAGETVTLPCFISMSDDQEVPSIEWSKEGQPRIFAYVYRGCEMFHEKNPVFHYRTHLFMNELKNGDMSLRLSNVSRSDSGIYVCKKIQKPPKDVARVELFVGAVSEPKLAVVQATDGAVTLQCEADCWFPEPQITFLDAQGNIIISAEDTKTEFSRGCITATKRLIVQTAQRITCRVHQPEINQTRVTEIYIPDGCLTSCTQGIFITVVTTVLLCGFLVALITFLCKKYVNCGRKHKEILQQSSPQSSTRSNAEDHNWRNQAELDDQKTIELWRQNAELVSNLHIKDETIRQLTEERNELRSRQRAIVFQHDQPTIGSPPSKPSPDVSKSINSTADPPPQDNKPKPAASTNNNRPKSDTLPLNKKSRRGVSNDHPAPGAQIQSSRRNMSCPVLMTPSDAEPSRAPSTFLTVGRAVSRSRSMSESQCRPKNTTSPRRSPMSAASFNRFALLANLPEDDSEPLLQMKTEQKMLF